MRTEFSPSYNCFFFFVCMYVLLPTLVFTAHNYLHSCSSYDFCFSGNHLVHSSVLACLQNFRCCTAGRVLCHICYSTLLLHPGVKLSNSEPSSRCSSVGRIVNHSCSTLNQLNHSLCQPLLFLTEFTHHLCQTEAMRV